MDEIPIFHNSKLHDHVIEIYSLVGYFFSAAVGLLLTAKQPIKISCMKLGEHNMKTKKSRRNNNSCLK